MLRNKSQSGNVFVFILLGVFLFGALIFTFTKSGQQGNSALTKQQTKIIAQDILNYAQNLERAVQKVRRNGCSESQINFNNSVIAGYSNTNAPVDGSCDIFGINGGNMEWQDPPSGASNYANYEILNNAGVEGIGPNSGFTDAAVDLVMVLVELDQNVCKSINENVGIDLEAGNIPRDSGDLVDVAFPGRYTGSFNFVNAISDSDNNCNGMNGDDFCGKPTGCFHELGGSQYYVFYHALLGR